MPTRRTHLLVQGPVLLLQHLDFDLHLGPALEKTVHIRQMLLVSQSLDLALRYVNLHVELGSKHLQLPNLLAVHPGGAGGPHQQVAALNNQLQPAPLTEVRPPTPTLCFSQLCPRNDSSLFSIPAPDSPEILQLSDPVPPPVPTFILSLS